MKCKRFPAIFAVFALALILGVSLQAIDLEKLDKAYQQAIKAYEAKDYTTYLDSLLEAQQYFPNHPLLLYRLAGAYALNGMPLKAMTPLRETAAMGLVFDVWKNADFRSLQKRPEFKRLLSLYEKNAQPLKTSRQAFTIPEKALLTEGLAYDPQDKKFFVSSVRQRKILRLDRTGRGDLLSKPEDDLWAVMGMKVDGPRRRLWAAMSAMPQMSGFKPEDEGRAGIVCYDLKTGRLAKKYLLPGKPETHLLGDLAVDAKGTVMATDSLMPVLYTPSAAGDSLDVFLTYDKFQSLQGIDFSTDGKAVFVADYSVGLYVIDRQTKTVHLLEAPKTAALIGIDGLYFFQGSLLAVQNGLKPNRILRVFLNKDYSRIERVAVLEANQMTMPEPTLGVIADGVFYFIANSQWALVDDKGRAAPNDKWKDPVILQVGIAGPPAIK
jgi:hypothetical protein